MSQYVTWFDSSETGAPVLNNANGSFIGVLDACLVTGFNNKAITSLVVAAGVATATCNGHGYSPKYGKDVLIQGATPAALNGRQALTFVDANTFKFATSAPSGTATGTITAKRDSLGWIKEFADTNKAVYKRSDVTATSIRMRVDDTGYNSGVNAIVTGVESPSDVDTFAAKMPTEAQVDLGFRWSKGSATTTAKQWTLIGDGKLFFLVTQSGVTVYPFSDDSIGTSGVYCFGDFESFKQGDAYSCMATGEVYSGSGTGTAFTGQGLGSAGGYTVNSNAILVARAFSQLGAAAPLGTLGVSRAGSGASSQLVFPSPIDSGYLLNPKVMLIEAVPGGLAARGFVPGFVEILGRYAIDHHEILDTVVDLPGRKLLGLRPFIGGVGAGRVAFDITGPWR